MLGCALGLLLFVGVHAGREFTSFFFQKSGQSQSGVDAPKPKEARYRAIPIASFCKHQVSDPGLQKLAIGIAR